MAKEHRSTATWAGIPATAPCALGMTGNPHIRRCAAKTHAGERCKQPAMRGKEVCRMHGGKAGRRPSTGVRAYDASKLAGKIEEAYKRHLNNPQIVSLNEEIALARAYFENYLATFTPHTSQHPPPLTSEFYDTLLSFLSRLSRLAKTKAEIEWGPQHLITATQAMVFFNAVIDEVFTHVKDPALRGLIINGLRGKLGLAGLTEGGVLSLTAPRATDESREGEDSGEVRLEASGKPRGGLLFR